MRPFSPLCFQQAMQVKLVPLENLGEAAPRPDRFRFWADPLGVKTVRGAWMRCGECSTDNPDGNSFCQSCGVRLGVACLQCGHQNSAKARFCGSCGVSLGVIEGERKQATILFADIVGSTQLITGMDPEQALARLQPSVAQMCEAVQRFDGTVVRTLGDGIMAAFGAPRAHEGHALLACEAALAIQAESPGRESAPLIRVGLHSGEIVSGIVLSDPTKEAGAHGVTVHLASRMQEMAEPGSICLTEDCYRLVRPYCDVRPLGRRPVKGLSEPIEVYGLTRLKPAVASQQFRRTNLTSFRGRDHELAIIQRTLQNAESGDTRVLGISGPPGAGKSRLCYEFAKWCRSRFIPVLEARAQLYGHATPLQPVLEFLRLWFRIESTEDGSVARERIARRVLTLAPTFQADLPLLYEFLGVLDSDSPPSRLPPKARHARLLEIIRHMVRQGGSEANVVIVEDLHWLDAASEDFVVTLVEAVEGTRTMLVLNFRPSYAAEWMKWPYYQQLSLAELSASQTEALVGELVGKAPELHDIRRRVAERSGGNPFFAEELVRSLAENDVVSGETGDYALGTNRSETALPATVEAVVAARIDRLAEDEKTVLQVGAVIGKEFPLVVLHQVIGRLASRVETVLSRLCEVELIQEQAPTDGRQFAFRHPLIQEVGYLTQLKSRRKALHAAVAKAMEEFYGSRLDEFAGLLSYHYEAAGRFLEAANYAARAATWLGSTNPAQAIGHWQKVAALLQDQPRSPTNDRLRIMAGGQIAWLGWREGMTAEAAKPYIAEAVELARETDDTMIPLLLFVDGRITVASGGPADTYVERAKEALSLIEGSGNLGRIATLRCVLSHAYGGAGLLREALVANDAALQLVSHVEKFDHQFLGYSVEHWVHSLRGRILVRLGRFAEAEQSFDGLLQVESTLADPTVQFIPHLGYVDLAWCRRDSELAEHHASRIREIASKSGNAYVQVYAFACAGTAKALAGEYEEAARDFSEGLQFVRKTSASVGYEPELMASLAECHCRMGESDRAIEIARETIDAARRQSTRLAECRVSITLGAAILQKGGAGAAQQAAEAFQQAERLIEITGARIYEPLLAQQRTGPFTLAS
jgi:class 3 adenylate cyclase/tetratricopeptide (TPR) repeat protein